MENPDPEITTGLGPWIGVKTAAAYLGAHPATVRAAMRTGALESVRLGSGPRSNYRTTIAWCDDYMKGQQS